MIGTSTRSHSHLHEERLFDCYLAARAGEPLDPPAADHLTDCADCAARYAELTTFMDGLRDEAEAETDAIFTAERRQRQQHEIARRLELVGRSARVIHFPHQAAPRQLPAPSGRRLPRWVAGTAAAGLVAGMAAGMFFERGGYRGRPVPVTQVAQAPRTGGAAVAPLTMAPPVSDVAAAAGFAGGSGNEDRSDIQERFLFELEVVADRPHTAELAAYDALTPHIREVSYTLAGR